MTDLISNMKRLAGVRENASPQYTIKEFGAYEGANPFLSGGDKHAILKMVSDMIDKHERSSTRDGQPIFSKIEIHTGDLDDH